METMPTVQIERVGILTDSMIHTIKTQGYTISDLKIDVESGDKSYNVYRFGKIVKRIIFDSDGRKAEVQN